MSESNTAKSNIRIFLDLRCYLACLLSCALGAVTWGVMWLISGDATVELHRLVIGWLTFSAFVVGMIDPRNPFFTGPSLWMGAFILVLPFKESNNPHAPYGLQMLLGLVALYAAGIVTGICVLVGTLIPTIIAIAWPLRSRGLRRWAGYADRDITMR